MMAEYTYEPGNWTITNQMIDDYNELGYIIVRKLFNEAEMKKITDAVTRVDGVLKHKFTFNPNAEKVKYGLYWSVPGNDVTGMVARCKRVVDSMEALEGGNEVYHWSSKLIMREKGERGHPWHQDYGTYYGLGFLRPEMPSVQIGVDKDNVTSGCLQLIPRSHKCGRIEHVLLTDRDPINVCDPKRAQEIEDNSEVVNCELDPGDALMFHVNLIHRTGDNNSESQNRGLLILYNSRKNPALWKRIEYNPLSKVSDSAIMECDNFTDQSGKEFWSTKTFDAALERKEHK